MSRNAADIDGGVVNEARDATPSVSSDWAALISGKDPALEIGGSVVELMSITGLGRERWQRGVTPPLDVGIPLADREAWQVLQLLLSA